jgi:hypothetical protein
VLVGVAGVTIQVTSTEPGLTVAPSSAYAPFVVPGHDAAPPDVRIDVSAHDLAGLDDGARECLFDSGGPWRLYRHDEGFLFRFFSSNLDSCPYKIARFAHDFSRGAILLHRPFFARTSPIDPLEYPLDELLVIALLGQGRGLEIHGCGVVDTDASGYLFVGSSGAGKSTMARLWLEEPGVVILSDDRIVVRRDADGLWMYGTPWHGEEPLASPRRARLARVFFLTQHVTEALGPVAPAEAVARLFTASFPPFHDARAVDFTLAFLAGIADNIPCLQLQFAPTSAVVTFVRRGNSSISQ